MITACSSQTEQTLKNVPQLNNSGGIKGGGGVIPSRKVTTAAHAHAVKLMDIYT